MKILNQILEESGIESETRDKVFEALKKSGSIVANSGEYVKIDKHSALEGQFADLETKWAEQEKKVAELAGYEKLKTDFAKLQEDKSSSEAKLMIGFEFEKKLMKDKVPALNGKYDAYINQLDLTGVSVVEGKVVGVEKVYGDFKKNNAALFDMLNTTTVPKHELPPTTKQEDKMKSFADMTLDERIKLKQDNPTLFATLNSEHKRKEWYFN